MGDLTYTAAGVDIGAGERAVELIKPLVASTHDRPEVIGGIGGFGGLFAVPDRYQRPVLVASTDGVGTKLEVARAAGRFDTVGIDLVAMCVDDLVCQGAEPLFFLDYLAVETLDPEQAATIVGGIVDGCRQAGCALIGGEMAEHGSAMLPGSFDLAGFAVGIVERDAILDGSCVQIGDVLIGLPSPGLRSNGYSLARAIVDRAGLRWDDPAWPGAERTLAEELLVPSVIYARRVMGLLRSVETHAVMHITGGGLDGNVPRGLQRDQRARIDRGAWEVPRIFTELIAVGSVDPEEAWRVWNMGIGMVVVVGEADVAGALDVLGDGVVIGSVVAREQ